MMKLTRRKIILLVIGGSVAFLLFSWRNRLKSLLFGPKGREVSSPTFDNPYVEAGKALVSIVKGEDEDAMVREAVKIVGGWERLQIAGKTVLVKPNVVTSNPPPTTTSAKVVEAIVKQLYDNGASQVLVGDMSALMTMSTKTNMEKTGIRKAAEQAGARVLYFEKHGWVQVPIPQAQYVRKAYVSEWIFNADVVINVPVIKTHRYATYSIALKNFIGATHPRQRPYLVDYEHWEEVIAELNLAYIPHLNIVDGTTIMVRGGPRYGDPQSPKVILVSGDRIAADVAGLSLIKHFGQWPDVAGRSVWEQRQIKRAIQLGLGVTSPEQVKIVSRSLNGGDSGFSELVQSIQGFLLQANNSRV